ncbi:MAG: type II toxin-antitoxin system HicA family toxin [Methylobacteriaceae bacterium]|nr:type II toxin-antitoxin system HicA family toxin [Methylobacteriaceae bacterium]
MVKRGKEPMWESAEFDELYVLAIPRHGNRDLAPGTKKSILDQLEDDVLAWEERLGDDEGKEDASGEDHGTG